MASSAHLLSTLIQRKHFEDWLNWFYGYLYSCSAQTFLICVFSYFFFLVLKYTILLQPWPAETSTYLLAKVKRAHSVCFWSMQLITK